jgi:ribosomal-protein-alanine N-acetyltransferase
LEAEEAPPGHVIEPVQDADFEAVLDIERLSFRTPWTREAFAEELRRSWARVEVLRASATGRVLAFCDYWLVADELHILNIATHPEARRRGHAARLLGNILEKARLASFRLVTLEVRKSNLAAQALYAGFGFKVIGTRVRYYEDNDEDAIVMTLEVGA